MKAGILLLLLSLLGASTGCSSSGSSSGSSDDTTPESLQPLSVEQENQTQLLDNTDWALDTIELSDGSLWVVRDIELPYPFSIKLQNTDSSEAGNGLIQGNFDCNGFSVPYTFSDSTLMTGIASVTDSECEQNSDVVGIVFRFFTGQMTLSVEVDSDSLRLTAGNNEALRYTRQ